MGLHDVDTGDLIEALSERWRPKTNTFHLPSSELTVKLEDVNVLYGLLVEGDAIVGYEGLYNYDDHRELCYGPA